MSEQSGVSQARAWFMVALLCVVYTFSLVDRMIPALIASDLRESLNITPVEFGLLVGTGFGVLYALIGIPIAQLIDRGNRKWIIAAGVALWGAATIMSGFAQSYEQLLLARAGVAIGEAALWPAAVSMIGDMFAANKRTRPTAVFVGTGQVMGSGLFLIGAGALALANVLAPTIGYAEWRTAFFVVGVPPVLIGLAWALLAKEPKREAASARELEHASIAGAARYLRAHGALYLGLYTVVALVNLTAFSLISWLPTILGQSHGMTPPEAGAAMGVAGIPACLLGATLSPVISVWLQKRGVSFGPVLVAALMITIATLALTTTVHADDSNIVLAGFSLGTFGLAGFSVLPTIMIQWVAPALLRGRLVAINQLAVNLIGLALGPPAVALIALHILGDGNAIAQAAAILFGFAGVAGACVMLMTSLPFARAYDGSRLPATPHTELRTT